MSGPEDLCVCGGAGCGKDGGAPPQLTCSDISRDAEPSAKAPGGARGHRGPGRGTVTPSSEDSGEWRRRQQQINRKMVSVPGDLIRGKRGLEVAGVETASLVEPGPWDVAQPLASPDPRASPLLKRHWRRHCPV